MFKAKTFSAILCLVLVGITACGAGELKDDWNDFLHYTKIGRYDLAKGYGQTILDGNPDPVALLNFTVANPQGFEILSRIHQYKPDADLAAVTDQILALIETGRNVRRADPELIVQEVKRLGTTARGKMIGTKRLQEAGEYAIPFMLDALADPDQRENFTHVTETLPKIGQSAIRPLTAALQTENNGLKSEILKALGKIGYPQSLPYLRYVMKNDASVEMRREAAVAIQAIDPTAQSAPAAELFFQLAEKYYYHHESLAPVSKAGKTNVWFWSTEKRRLVWRPVDSVLFHEVMAMRTSEWALRADPGFGLAIGLWQASFFKAEATGLTMPVYFGEGHANAYVYGTTAGPVYLLQALARALNDKDTAVALAATEALIATTGSKTIFYPVGPKQPLLSALVYGDTAVRTSAAIAIAQAGPRGQFGESDMVVKNLTAAIADGLENQDAYVARSIAALRSVTDQRNQAFNLLLAQGALLAATRSNNAEYKVMASQALAGVHSTTAQEAIAAVALDDRNELATRISGFQSLAEAAKIHGSLLSDPVLRKMYDLIGSGATDATLRAAAAMAFGALNLPSEHVKDLILDQAKS